jgi:hypothetical protein
MAVSPWQVFCYCFLTFTKSYITPFRAIYKSFRISGPKTDIGAAVRPPASPVILHFRQFIGACWQASAARFTVLSSQHAITRAGMKENEP